MYVELTGMNPTDGGNLVNDNDPLLHDSHWIGPSTREDPWIPWSSVGVILVYFTFPPQQRCSFTYPFIYSTGTAGTLVEGFETDSLVGF